MGSDRPISEGFRTPGWGQACADHEVVVWELAENLIEVRDPLCEQPYRIGDSSLITDPTAEAIVLANWRYNARNASTRQLTNTEPFTTKTGTDRWSRMGHELSVAAMTAGFGGSPTEIIEAAVHDEGHRVASHRTDDLLAGRGAENAHDKSLVTYFQRNGFMQYLESKGLVDQAGVVPAYGLKLVEIIEHDEQLLPRSFVNQPGSTGSLEVERLQYIAEEACIWIYEPKLVREGLSHALRAEHPQYGEHIVFDDVEAARLFQVAQTRCLSEHWAEPLNDVVDELLMTIDRRVLTSTKLFKDEPTVQYYPGDVLYTSQEDWEAKYANLASHDAFTAGIIKIATGLARQQRAVHAGLQNDNSYRGPMYPSWMSAQTLLHVTNVDQGITARSKHYLLAEMRAGKNRSIDPWVVQANGDWQRLSTLVPETVTYRQKQTGWTTGDAYVGIIDYDHPALKLTPAERKALAPGLRRIRENWPAALARPLMPNELLTEQVTLASLRTRQRARTTVETTADILIA